MLRSKENSMALLKKKTKADGQSEGIGTKALLAFITILVVFIWLGIVALLIKTDFGGFGSTVLRPIIKDIPYLNLICYEDIFQIKIFLH